MAFQVIKTIKGRRYLYLQSTYREGDKVKAISHYVGAVDSVSGAVTKAEDDPDQLRSFPTADLVNQVLAEDAESFDPLRPQDTIIKIRQVLKAAKLQEQEAQKAKSEALPEKPYQGESILGKFLEEDAERLEKEKGRAAVQTATKITKAAVKRKAKPTPAPEPRKASTQPTKPSAERGSGNPTPKKSPDSSAPSQPKPSPPPAPTFKLKADANISYTALRREHQNRLNTLRIYGVDPAKMPPVTVKHGSNYRHYKPAFRNGLVVTAPRYKFNREKLRTEYRRALHRSFIDTLEQEAPESLHPFKYAFDASYRQTQDALTRYLMNTESKDKFYKVLALKFFSMMNPVPIGKGKKLSPDKIGLVEYGKRKDWKDEYTSLMTAIDKHGIEKLSKNAHTQIANATKQQRKRIKMPTIFFIRKRRKVRMLQARIDANKLMIRKLELIRQYSLHTKIR